MTDKTREALELALAQLESQWEDARDEWESHSVGRGLAPSLDEDIAAGREPAIAAARAALAAAPAQPEAGFISTVDVEKLLCKRLGIEWSVAGISIESLIDRLAAAPQSPQPESEALIKLIEKYGSLLYDAGMDCASDFRDRQRDGEAKEEDAKELLTQIKTALAAAPTQAEQGENHE